MRERKYHRSEAEDGGPDANPSGLVALLTEVGDQEGDREGRDVVGAGDEATLEAVQAEAMFKGGDTDVDQTKGRHSLDQGQRTYEEEKAPGVVENLSQTRSVSKKTRFFFLSLFLFHAADLKYKQNSSLGNLSLEASQHLK